VKSYRVDFKFTVEEQASMYVIADDPEIAKTGALEILLKTGGVYGTSEVTSVEEYNPIEAPIPSVTIN